MNKIAIATCLLALLALNAIGEAGNPCVERLVKGVGSVRVPWAVKIFVSFVEAELPFEDEIEWSGLSDAERQKCMFAYPVVSCEKFVEMVNAIFKRAISGDKKCARELNRSEEALKEARSHKVLGPVMRAREACIAFEPHTRDEGELM